MIILKMKRDNYMISVLCDWCSDTKCFRKLVVSCVYTHNVTIAAAFEDLDNYIVVY